MIARMITVFVMNMIFWFCYAEGHIVMHHLEYTPISARDISKVFTGRVSACSWFSVNLNYPKANISCNSIKSRYQLWMWLHFTAIYPEWEVCIAISACTTAFHNGVHKLICEPRPWLHWTSTVHIQYLPVLALKLRKSGAKWHPGATHIKFSRFHFISNYLNGVIFRMLWQCFPTCEAC